MVGSRTLGGSLVARVLFREARRVESWAKDAEEEEEEEVSSSWVSRHTCNKEEEE